MRTGAGVRRAKMPCGSESSVSGVVQLVLAEQGGGVGIPLACGTNITIVAVLAPKPGLATLPAA